MAFRAYVFDLDGTLLNTLPDLVNLTNMVLREWDMPARTTKEINSFVGNGARTLLKRAASPGTADEVINAILTRWKELYPRYGHQFTQPYDGMPETLVELKAQGAKLGVLSNKFDAAVVDVIGNHFPGIFDVARGERPDTPRKPDPTGLRRMIADFGVHPSDVAYIGDTGTDMTVAIAAGAFPIGVAWGYRSADELWERGAQKLIDTPADLLEL